MGFTAEKFKDASPESTVERIIGILHKLNISAEEKWHDSGLDNCHSLTLQAKGGFPTSNGKGITKALARASAYGEFIERLQSGLFFYKFQSFEEDESVNLQCFAPDGRYYTEEELIKNADWLDFITESYKGLNRESLAHLCSVYAHSNNGKILCIPFYSLFEDKYIYLPAGFIEHIYSANGCCAGNTAEEALVHALSEIMERKASVDAVTKGSSFPEIPHNTLNTFPTVNRILSQLRKNEDLDVKVFDCSADSRIPVVSTRIINKKSQSYHVNFATDPVLEIAIERSLTETFQSRNIGNICLNEAKPILSDAKDACTSSNILNQLESGNGYFTADYFTEELTCHSKAHNFEDNSHKTNRELLSMLLGIYKDLKKPLLIRNYDFLGFPCYKIIVPGFSESRPMKLTEDKGQYPLASLVSRILRNPKAFETPDLMMIPVFNRMVSAVSSRRNNFSFLSGLPLEQDVCFQLWNVTMAYCSHILGDFRSLMIHTDALAKSEKVSSDDREYFACLRQYFTLNQQSINNEKLMVILSKFNKKIPVEKLRRNLRENTLFDEYLLACDGRNCTNCRYKNACRYDSIRTLINSTGKVYSEFTHGQNPKNFPAV